MSEPFEEEEKELIVDDEDSDLGAVELEDTKHSLADARRRLEKVLEEKRLRDELEDFLDY